MRDVEAIVAMAGGAVLLVLALIVLSLGITLARRGRR